MFGEIAFILSNWPNKPIPEHHSNDDSIDRLYKVLREFVNEPNNVGQGDLAGLIAHVLRKESLLKPDRKVRLTVPKGSGWPDEETWRLYGLNVDLSGPTWYQITASSWLPDWLEPSLKEAPLDEAIKETIRRPSFSVKADPFLPKVLNQKFNDYTCRGQRMAVRTTLLSNEGSVLIVNLPTGTGKSLVSWVLAMIKDTLPGLTLVVVPTVALALDQERQVRNLFSNHVNIDLPLAWYAGLSAELRQLVKTYIRQGNQRILFASPESVVKTLSPALYKAAEQGLIKAIIIDEAHLINQWGSGFRPEFQALAGLVANLREHCPIGMQFKTVLMTATMTAESYIALKTFYSPTEEPLLVSEVHLRPEPTYYIRHFSSELDRKNRISELIRFLPRPFIIYVTSPDDTYRWMELIGNLGMLRVGIMHGGSSPEDRERVVGSWYNDELDVVVATSAFGLGMDKANVRAVIHACVPETVDRYYQEVGRGGRDGKASLSFIMYVDSDVTAARKLNNERIISVELGLERWRAMLSSCTEIDDEPGFLSVKLDSKHKDIIQDSEENEAWNLRTILLMARSGLLELESKPPPLIEFDEETDSAVAEEERSTAMQLYFKSRFVRVDAGHSNPAIWQQKVEDVRSQIKKTREQGFHLMCEILNGSRELSTVLVDTYCISDAGVNVQATCGGCPVCRKMGRCGLSISSGYLEPPTLNIKDVDPILRDVLGPMVSYRPVFYSRPGMSRSDKRKWHRQIIRILRRLVSLGILEIAASQSFLEDEDYRELYLKSPQNFIFHTPLEEAIPIEGELQMPRVTLLDPEVASVAMYKKIMKCERPIHIVIAPDDIPSPVDTHRRLMDVVDHLNLSALNKRLEL